MLVYHAQCPAVCYPTPTFQGCQSDLAKSLPYCDTSKTHEERANDIISRLTIDELIAILSPTHPPYCECHTPPIKSIDLPAYRWLAEMNSNIAVGCAAPGRCVTTFIGPLGCLFSYAPLLNLCRHGCFVQSHELVAQR